MVPAFIARLLRVAPNVWTTSTQTVEQQVRTRLGAPTETEIRVFIDNSKNFGNQACSVLLLNRLVDDYGFTGAGKTARLVYPVEDAAATLGKLALLIRGLDATNPGPILDYRGSGVTLAFCAIDQLPAVQVNYGFTGGGDSSRTRPGPNWFASTLRVRLFLRLQPYQWFGGEHEVQYGGANVARPPYDLATPSALGVSFNYRGWYVPDASWAAPDEATWADYEGNPATRDRTLLAHALLDFLANNPGQLQLMPVYGVKDQNQMHAQVDQILPAIVATALGTSYLDPATRPVLVVSMNDVPQALYDNSLRVSQGGRTRIELLSQQLLADAGEQVGLIEVRMKAASADAKPALAGALQTARDTLARESAAAAVLDAGWRARQAWLAQRNAAQGVCFVSGQALPGRRAVTVAQLNDRLAALIAPGAAGPAVLFLELGGLPVPVFHYLMSRSVPAAIFEGANSNNLALNQGRWYLRMRSSNAATDVRYPQSWYASRFTACTKAAMRSVAAADAITGALAQTIGTPTPFVANINLAAAYLQPDAALADYYRQNQAYFHDAANDKLMLGLSYFNQIAIDSGL